VVHLNWRVFVIIRSRSAGYTVGAQLAQLCRLKPTFELSMIGDTVNESDGFVHMLDVYANECANSSDGSDLLLTLSRTLHRLHTADATPCVRAHTVDALVARMFDSHVMPTERVRIMQFVYNVVVSLCTARHV
jgi:hypothetical protein